MMNRESKNMMDKFFQTKIYCSFLLMLFTLLFNGCGEFAYKRGANLSDLEIAKKSCRAKRPDSAAVEKCMADSGWVVQDLSKMGPMDADPVVEASAIPSDRRIENSASAKSDEQRAEDYAVASAGLAQPTTIVNERPDMTDIFKISSWWKSGSGANNLKADTGECVAKLGETHRPDNHTQNVTRGLLLCMKEKGWSALRAK
jgi:hypothetical protein